MAFDLINPPTPCVFVFFCCLHVGPPCCSHICISGAAPFTFPIPQIHFNASSIFYLGRSSLGTGSGTGKEKARISGAGRSSSSSGRKKVSRPRFAFQTRSANDILDDGYRWRKYSAHPRGTGRCREARGLLGARVAARLPPLVECAGRRRPPREPWSAWAAAEEHGSQPSEPAVVIFFFFS
ncbi:uncharacterized protein LOC120667146 isoform X2 [Panicum virgatum]|uniref:uncharacterized protein LOC120667146 isoform X2 n=1 Tax=Panicum virgatum TaxID=38727 RepID=UPI0019D59E38|nr:uncharacterized protein LOC120667146 isoform X2 [Panicum virgatum]